MDWSALSPAFYGFGLGFSLIAAIGAQNAFVLKHGLQGKPVFWICLSCALSDALLISLGVGGFQALLTRWPNLDSISRYGGALFLFAYGCKSFYASYKPSAIVDALGSVQNLPNPKTQLRDVLTCLAFTFLNPHVYLDTVVLLGSVSAKFGENAAWFGFGAIVASFSFFFTLGYASKRMAPWFASPRSWQVLDALVGVMMWALALQLLLG